MSEEPCLHCYVWDAINQYFRDTHQVDPETGGLLYDERYIYGNLGSVLAEVMAALPNRPRRKEAIEVFNKHLKSEITKKIATGCHPETKKVNLQ